MLNEERRGELEAICKRFGVIIAYAFGSRAREVWEWVMGQRSHLAPSPSDVDIGVKLRPGHTLSVLEKVELAQALEDFFGVPRVDLVLLEEAGPFLAANIVRGDRLYADDSRLADEYELYVLRRAGDLEPLERERIALILGMEEDENGSGPC